MLPALRTLRTGIALATIGFLPWSSSSQAADASSVTSPDGRLVVTIDTADGQPVYSATWRGKPLVEPSAIRLESKGGGASWRLVATTPGSTDRSWAPSVGKRMEVRDHANTLLCRFASDTESGCLVEFVAYDDGFAFRISSRSLAPDNVVETTRSEFRLAGDPTLWWYRRERAPHGPKKLSELKRRLSPPVLVDLADGAYAAIHEAALQEGPWLELRAEGGAITPAGATPVSAEHSTPWRVVMVGDTLAELRDSDLLANLNPKANPDEFSWVKPGVALWDWRSWGYTAPDGFKYGLDLPSWKRFIDFAAEHEIPYLVLDADWYGPEMDAASDPFEGHLAADVRTAIKYGKERNVGLILYLNDVAGRKYGIEKILKAWSGWGAAGIKYGFMRTETPAKKVAWTRKIVRLCAENKLLINFHDGPVPPTGDEAMYPNWITREFCHAQSDAKRAFTPTTFLQMMGVHQLAGPIDMNNGMFDLNRSVADRPRVFVEVPATITAEAARTLIVYSGTTIIPDTPDIYRKHPELLRFITAQKMPWAESRTLAFEFGKHITVMRQTGDTYLVASATNEEARTLSIPLDFLPAGKSFTAIACEDAADAHYLENREAYATRTLTVNSQSTIEVTLAPGGGHCLLITPVE